MTFKLKNYRKEGKREVMVLAAAEFFNPKSDQGGGNIALRRIDNVLIVVEDLEAVNALGIRRVMFAVDDIDDVVARMRAHGSELIGEMRYEDSYRLAYIRGPEGIIVGLAEEIRKASPSRGKSVARSKPVSRANPTVSESPAVDVLISRREIPPCPKCLRL